MKVWIDTDDLALVVNAARDYINPDALDVTEANALQRLSFLLDRRVAQP